IVQISNSDIAMIKGNLQRTVNRSMSENFVDRWPDELRLGFAYQPWRAITLVGDVVRHGPGEGSTSRVKRAETINFALGNEILLANTLFLRTGYFTNIDATASRDLNSPNQREEYMDYKGVSLSTGLKLRTGDYGIHYTEQRGTGFAEKVVGKQNPSTGKLQVISISASQSFQ
ncbi:hypothetical protein EBR21_14175, partial [bacterium]|nr:hypothetical protein [bacterium]